MVEGKNVLHGVTMEEILGQIPEQITGICCDSRQIQEGDLFVALHGQNFDGHNYLPDIARHGANAAVVDHFGSPRSLPQIRVKDTLASLPRIAANFYGNPAQKLKLFGVTGSNGKTTSVYLMEQVKKIAGNVPGVLGTIDYRYQDIKIPAETTTPLPHILHKIFRQFVDAGCRDLVMEASSHGLMLHRLDEVEFDVALFTNLSQDHLDFHQTMEAYREAKKRLFTHHLKKDGSAVFNLDDETGQRFKNECVGINQLTYGIDLPADVQATTIKMDAKGSEFVCKSPVGTMHLKTNLIGRHNIYNILGVVASAIAYGIEPNEIEDGINEMRAVPGRLEQVQNSIGTTIVVDYCHTPDALEKCLQTLNSLPHNRLLTVFGCGGDRDKTKRPLMGKIAASLSDKVFITNDNPRTEDPKSILDDIEVAVKDTSVSYATIEDRREAIGTAVKELDTGDVLLIAGKGHEDYQILGKTKIHFDDREVAREWLQHYGKGAS